MAWRPTFRTIGLTAQARFGSLGAIQRVVGHYTAGPIDRDDAHARQMFRSYAELHRRNGWGGISYHYGIARSGSLFLLRRVAWKGAHVAGMNTGSIGIVMHGTTGHRPTEAQARTLRWLLANAHTNAMPARHRTPRSLAGVRVFGHNDFNATACPGAFKTVYTSRGTKR